MGTWFQDHIRDLLPAHYLTGDESTDLRAFLQLPLSELDRFKDLTDEFPALFDVDNASPVPLALLGKTVAIDVDGRIAPELERRRIVEAIPRFQRKGTLPALERDLKALGWEGLISENYRDACRLNLRADLNRRRLAGVLNSHGVYQIQCFNQVGGLRDAQAFHHPAGTRAFWLQWFLEQLSLVEGITADAVMHLRYLCYANIDETFVLNRSQLGHCNHLTCKQHAWGLFQISSVSMVDLCIEKASTCLSRWHGRQDRMRLNKKSLNHWRIPNVWESELKYIECHNIYVGSVDTFNPEPLVIGQGKLNRDSLSLGIQDRMIRFKKKDFFAESKFEGATNLGDIVALSLGNAVRQSPVLRINGDPLRPGTRLGPDRNTENAVVVSLMGASLLEPELAMDLVDRYGKLSRSFLMNQGSLNRAALPSLHLDERRARFELRVQTSSDRKRQINMAIGKGAMNQTHLASTTPTLRWMFRQRDLATSLYVPIEFTSHIDIT